MANHVLSLEVPTVMNPCILKIFDTSVYTPLIPITCPTLNITVPGFGYSNQIDRLNEVIDCEDTFYEFKFNRVYTVAGLIDEYKKGAKGRFIGIKEIDNQDCESSVNKFPVNDGFRNFDLLFFVFSIFLLLTVDLRF